MGIFADHDYESEWGQMTTAAFLGLEKTAGGCKPLLPSRGEANPGRQFLDDLAVIACYRQCGKTGVRRSPAASNVSADSSRTCSIRAAGHLAQILFGPYSALLPQWCEGAARKGVTAAPEMVPELLNIAKQKREYRLQIRSIVGECGRRLVKMNPEWADVLKDPVVDPSIWQTGERAERIEYLTALRSSDLSAARECLMASWQQEGPDDRALFLGCLLTGLCDADEPFLEQALDDKRKAVREAAADLLARLPGSGYRQRMKERALSVIRYQPPTKVVIKIGHGKFDITTPDTLDKTWLRDFPESKAVRGMGVKAVILTQIVAAVDLAEWTRGGASIQELIQAVVKSDWAEALLLGWSAAAARQQNREWAKLFLIHRSLILPKADLRYAGLLHALQPTVHESIMVELIPTFKDWDSLATLLEIAEYPPGPWSQSFSKMVVNAMKFCSKELVENRLRTWMETAVRHHALCMDPTVLSIMEDGWPRDNSNWGKAVTGHLDRWISILKFRQDMQREFES